MEISIKWNVCRVCLIEERPSLISPTTKYTAIDTKIAKQIYDIAGVQMQINDNLPDKICRKCLLLLKYACHFSTTCRNSDEYLQSIIRKTKSATSMIKLDKQRERSVQLMDEIFIEDSDFTMDLLEHVDVQEDSKIVDVDFIERNDFLAVPKSLPTEKSGDSAEHNLMGTASNTTTALRMQTQHHAQTTNFVMSQVKSQKVKDSTGSPFIGIFPNEKESLEHHLVNDGYDDNEKANNVDENSRFNQNPLRIKRNRKKSDCSINIFDYPPEGDADPVDILDVVNEHSECSWNNNNQINERDNSNTKEEQKNNTPAVDDEQHNINNEAEAAEAGDLLYIIKVEEDAIRMEDDLTHAENLETANVANNAPAILESDNIVDDNMQLITDCASDEVGECVNDEDAETNKSMTQLEEYLIEESDTETIIQQDFEFVQHQIVKRPNTTTIRLNERQQRYSPDGRQMVNDVYMFNCSVCGNNFTSRSLRNSHMRIHRNERNFECELCYKRFTAACNLTAHMRIHTGEKPYECKYCMRKFTDRSTHIKHERIHTNERPFQCNMCGKSFSLSTTLRTHEKVHTNEKPFKCMPCNKSFKLPHQLKSHMHTNQHKNVMTASELDGLD